MAMKIKLKSLSSNLIRRGEIKKGVLADDREKGGYLVEILIVAPFAMTKRKRQEECWEILYCIETENIVYHCEIGQEYELDDNHTPEYKKYICIKGNVDTPQPDNDNLKELLKSYLGKFGKAELMYEQ